MKDTQKQSNFEEVILVNEEEVKAYIETKTPMANFGVNLSGQVIPVYSSAGGSTKVGQLNNTECFAFTGSKTTVSGNEWHQIEFLSPNGWRGGWYKGVNGVSIWKNKPYSTSSYEWCICKAGSFQGNFKYYRVMKTASVKDSTGEHAFYIYPNELVMVTTSDTPSGSSYHHLMKIRAVKGTGSNTQLLCCCHQTGEHFAYADTGINKTSTSPNIKGNW